MQMIALAGTVRTILCGTSLTLADRNRSLPQQRSHHRPWWTRRRAPCFHHHWHNLVRHAHVPGRDGHLCSDLGRVHPLCRALGESRRRVRSGLAGGYPVLHLTSRRDNCCQHNNLLLGSSVHRGPPGWIPHGIDRPLRCHREWHMGVAWRVAACSPLGQNYFGVRWFGESEYIFAMMKSRFIRRSVTDTSSPSCGPALNHIPRH